MKCLDTDLLVAILRGENSAANTLSELDEVRNATTTVNAFEIFYGANHSLRKAENVQKVRALLQRLDVAPFTLQSSERAGEILADLARSGELIDYRDAMIAGIVVESGLTLVTRNRKHFARIPKLKLEAW
ncbi:MAG: type II toxin-antitoxin system VapC family toxin [Nitrososphaerales archaeon]